MKKLFYTMVLLGFLTSCRSVPGRVCGGRGGGRCVENIQMHKKIYTKVIV